MDLCGRGARGSPIALRFQLVMGPTALCRPPLLVPFSPPRPTTLLRYEHFETFSWIVKLIFSVRPLLSSSPSSHPRPRVDHPHRHPPPPDHHHPPPHPRSILIRKLIFILIPNLGVSSSPSLSHPPYSSYSSSSYSRSQPFSSWPGPSSRSPSSSSPTSSEETSLPSPSSSLSLPRSVRPPLVSSPALLFLITTSSSPPIRIYILPSSLLLAELIYSSPLPVSPTLFISSSYPLTPSSMSHHLPVHEIWLLLPRDWVVPSVDPGVALGYNILYNLPVAFWSEMISFLLSPLFSPSVSESSG